MLVAESGNKRIAQIGALLNEQLEKAEALLTEQSKNVNFILKEQAKNIDLKVSNAESILARHFEVMSSRTSLLYECVQESGKKTSKICDFISDVNKAVQLAHSKIEAAETKLYGVSLKVS